MGAQPRLYTSRWQGMLAVDVTLAHLLGRCLPLADHLAARRRSCLLAYDTRFMAPLFARAMLGLLRQRGVSVQLATTPSALPMVHLALAQGRADCALCVSAGSLPYWYSGLLLVSRYADDRLPAEATAAVVTEPFPPPPLDEHDPVLLDLRAPYVEHLRSHLEAETIRRSMMTIFVDVMGGATTGIVPAIIGESQTKAIEINREPDPLFGKLTPHPAENGLARLRKLVRESDSNLGVAISADGTALGIVDKTGLPIDGNLVLLLLARYLQSQYRNKGIVVAPDAARPLLGRYEQSLGLRIEYAIDVDLAIAALSETERASLLVAHAPPGCYYIGKPTPTADASLAALLVIEMLARAGGKLAALLVDLGVQTM